MALRKAAALTQQQLASLPPERRRQIMQLLDAFIERGQLERRAGAEN